MGSASDLRFLARSVVKPKPGSREFEKLLLTGFDFRSLKQSIFHKRVLLFDTSSGSKEEEEEDGFDFELCSKKLKETLAITLDKCYPFAGRLVQEEDGTLVFLSNDAGVEFIDAASPVSISELLGNDRFQFEERLCPDIPFELEQLAKGGGGSSAAAAVPILAAQMTRFDQGGFAIGVTLHHGASDGTSVFQFLKLWAEISRGDEVSSPLDFSSRAQLLNLTPHTTDSQLSTNSEIPKMFTTAPLFCAPKLELPQQPETAMKILFISLDIEAVNKLKLKVQEDQKEGVASFSSYVIITALMWRASIRARQLQEEEETRCFNAVNCRGRCKRLPENHFGNAAFTAIAAAPAGHLLGNGISFAAKLIAKSIKSVSGEYLQSMSNLMEQVKLQKSVLLADFRPPHDVLVVGSSHNPSAECDFGWGQPLALKSTFMEAPLSALIWCPRHRVTGTLELIYKATPAVADAMLIDPELTTFAKVESSEVV
jgi:hypothetical protein